MMRLRAQDPLAVNVVRAIQKGEVATLGRLLEEHPGLVHARIEERRGDACVMSRTLLHVATDWPGHYPNGVKTVRLLIQAGADVNGRFEGGHTETPLHWAASSDDVAVLDVMLDAGAEIDATGGVIADGTALMDAASFGQWQAARRLVERGAKVGIWEASALGLMERLREFFARDPLPSAEQVTSCFWGACHGGQRETAEYLLGKGATLNWIGYNELTPFDAARRSGANAVVGWLYHLGGRSTAEVKAPPKGEVSSVRNDGSQ